MAEDGDIFREVDEVSMLTSGIIAIKQKRLQAIN